MIIFSGEVGLLAGVAFVRKGCMTLTELIAIGAIASFIANMLYFYAGKLLWNKWNFLRIKLSFKVEKSWKFVNRFGTPLMIFSRFLYGIRNVIPIALGIYKVNNTLFIIYNLIGAIIWALVFSGSGYALTFHLFH